MSQIYFDDFSRITNQADLAGELPEGAISEASEILFACYSNDTGWDGHAVVIFRTAGGALMAWSGGHCSCYGLQEGSSGVPPFVLTKDSLPSLGGEASAEARQVYDLLTMSLGF